MRLSGRADTRARRYLSILHVGDFQLGVAPLKWKKVVPKLMSDRPIRVLRLPVVYVTNGGNIESGVFIWMHFLL